MHDGTARLLSGDGGGDSGGRVERRGRSQEAWAAPRRPPPHPLRPSLAGCTVPPAGKLGTFPQSGSTVKPFSGTKSGHIRPGSPPIQGPPATQAQDLLSTDRLLGRGSGRGHPEPHIEVDHDAWHRTVGRGWREDTRGAPRMRWPWARPGL